MKICVLSDVHGNAVALQKVIDECNTLNIDKYIFLGDLLIKGPSPNKCYELMLGLNPLCWIKGNTDEAFDLVEDWATLVKDNMLLSYLEYPLSKMNRNSIDLLLNMNYRESLTIDGIKILCTHGSPRDIAENIYPDINDEDLSEIIEGVDEDIILCGHTHYPMIRTYKGKTIFNPGSISFSVDDENIISYGIIEINDNNYSCTLKVLEYDKEKALSNAIENHMPNIEDFKSLIDYKL